MQRGSHSAWLVVFLCLCVCLSLCLRRVARGFCLSVCHCLSQCLFVIPHDENTFFSADAVTFECFSFTYDDTEGADPVWVIAEKATSCVVKKDTKAVCNRLLLSFPIFHTYCWTLLGSLFRNLIPIMLHD